MSNSHETSNVEISTYLLQYREEVPQWLETYDKGVVVTFADVLSGRVGYYPGSGFDGTLVKVGNKSHAVHSFLYVDYAVSKDEMIAHLSEPSSILGYHSIGRIEWTERDIMPNGQYLFDVNLYKKGCDPMSFANQEPYCFTEILERNADRDDAWGAKRFALTLLCADGIATYYQLFCREYKFAPWIFLLQDHGFGLNYDRFGKGGILDAIIREYEVRPTFVLCDTPRNVWEGYEHIPGLVPISRRCISDERELYRDVARNR